MNIAPSMRPPAVSSLSMNASALSPLGNIKVSSATVPMYATGMCQVITRRQMRYIPPAISSTADISPIEPAQRPRKRSRVDVPGTSPAFSDASGVASAIASILPVKEKTRQSSRSKGAGKAVICPGHAKRNARPANAGLRKFFPMPPKSCFTTTMAKNAPTTGIQYDTAEGRLRPSSKPVTTAERSPTVQGRCSIRRTRYSNSTDDATEMSTTTRARGPKT